MKARTDAIVMWLKGMHLDAAIAVTAARIAPRVGYDASKQFAVKMGCPIALWRIAYLCEMGKSINK